MLEAKIAELTEAVKVLTETLQALGSLQVAAQPAKETPKACPSSRADADAEQDEAEKATPYSIQEVREALLAIPKPEAKRILREFDVERLPDLHPDAYPNVIRHAKQVAA